MRYARRCSSVRWSSTITGASVSPSCAAARMRPWPAITSPSPATSTGTVQPNFAIDAAIFATWSAPWVFAFRA